MTIFAIRLHVKYANDDLKFSRLPLREKVSLGHPENPMNATRPFSISFKLNYLLKMSSFSYLLLNVSNAEHLNIFIISYTLNNRFILQLLFYNKKRNKYMTK